LTGGATVVILGISAFFHDSAAAVLVDGEIRAAAQEERFTRLKHDARFPTSAIRAVLSTAGVAASDIDAVAFFEKPFLKFERLIETYAAHAPRGFRSFSKAAPIWIKEKLFQKNLLQRELRRMAPDVDWSKKLLFAEHHQSHAASAFYPSPFERAVVLTADGVGEWATTSVSIGDGADLRPVREIHFPHSLGLLYSAFTYYLGFRVNSGEYKVMGLAPYGVPKYRDLILETLIDVRDDGSFALDLKYFAFPVGLEMTNDRFHALFGGPPRKPEGPLDQRHLDLAASVQAVAELVMRRMARALRRDFDLDALCLAGGVALNCVANGLVKRDGAFRDLWIQPAAGDAGGALGAALAAYHAHFGRPRPAPATGQDSMGGAYLGPAYDQEEIDRQLHEAGAVFERLDSDKAIQRTARALAAGKAVGWHQGRMEFGPRALGARSILADPRGSHMQRALNLRIKFRESFRPFAPAVLAEEASKWFNHAGDSPYMLVTTTVAEEHRLDLPENLAEPSGLAALDIPRSDIPAVTHVDGSARVQTVHRETNPRFHALLTAFLDLTGCPVLVNTSFNVRGEPIVDSPSDAYRCFMGTDLEFLCVGDSVLVKEMQPDAPRREHGAAFAPD
jgi:carbamoyltransferase